MLCPFHRICRFAGSEEVCKLEDLTNYCAPFFKSVNNAFCNMCGRQNVKCVQVNDDVRACMSCFKNYTLPRIGQVRGISVEQIKQISARL